MPKSLGEGGSAFRFSAAPRCQGGVSNRAGDLKRFFRKLFTARLSNLRPDQQNHRPAPAAVRLPRSLKRARAL
jgi:hypothetical protein